MLCHLLGIIAGLLPPYYIWARQVPTVDSAPARGAPPARPSRLVHACGACVHHAATSGGGLGSGLPVLPSGVSVGTEAQERRLRNGGLDEGSGQWRHGGEALR